MQEDGNTLDADIVRTAYAERVKDLFKVFAESLSMGEKEQGSRERFLRSIEMLRHARDVALEVMHGSGATVEPTAEAANGADAGAAEEELSADLQEIVNQAVGGTTGQKQFGGAR
jgi:hypothetical protein